MSSADIINYDKILTFTGMSPYMVLRQHLKYVNI